MRQIKVHWKRVSLALALIALSLGTYTIYRGFSAPNGNTWTIEGAGFCIGTYTVYNNTAVDSKLYGMRCDSGQNVCNAFSDLGALLNQCVIADSVFNVGGSINFRQGLYAVFTTIIIGRAGMFISGAAVGFPTAGAEALGTIFRAKASNMIMLEAGSNSGGVTCTSNGCTGQQFFQGVTIQNIFFDAAGKANIGIDWATTETATLERFKNDFFYSTGATGFNVAAMILDGQEDTIVDSCSFGGAGVQPAAAVDIQWQVPIGNIAIVNTFMGGIINLVAWAQQISITTSTISSLKLTGGASRDLIFVGNYLGNSQGAGRLQLNSQTIDVVTFNGDFISTTATIPFVVGGGTIKTMGFSGTDWNFPGAANTWNSGGATLTKQTTEANNHVIGGTLPTGFPFTPDGNNNF